MTEHRNGLSVRPGDIKMAPVTKIMLTENYPRMNFAPKDKAYKKIAASVKGFGLV